MQRPKTRANLADHFKRRMEERYGIAVNRQAYLDLCNRVRKRADTVMLFKESVSRSHWLLTIDGRLVYAVYNRNYNALCTALPFKALLRVLDRPDQLSDENAVRRYLETRKV